VLTASFQGQRLRIKPTPRNPSSSLTLVDLGIDPCCCVHFVVQGLSPFLKGITASSLSLG
jgi:hypothetical protein